MSRPTHQVRAQMRMAVSGVLMGALALSQAGAQAHFTGAVSGHVYSAETNQPLRLATVTLVGTGSGMGGGGGGALTDLQGAFVVSNVQAGSYAVVTRMPGYVTPVSPEQQSVSEAQGRAPVVRVEENQVTPIEVRLEQGAALSGVIRFEDGSPAEGLEVRPFVRTGTATWQAFTSRGAAPGRSDDRGRYRIAGLPPGVYTLEATLPLTSTGVGSGLARAMFLQRSAGSSTLKVFSGGVFRVKDASAIDLHAGEERTDADLQIPLTGLHAIHGTVAAMSSGRSVGGGTVRLLSADDRTVEREVPITPDGSFALENVPTGEYLIHVEARPPDRRNGPQTGGFQSLEQPLRLEGDLLDLGLDVQAAP